MRLPAQRLLRALRSPEQAEGPWEDTVQLALVQGVAPILHHRLQAAGVLGRLPPALAERLAGERHATALANLRHYGEFRRIARLFLERGIALVPLKGLHLAERVYRDISLRPMADLDVLVPRERVTDALVALRSAGYGGGFDPGDARALLEVKCNIGLAHPAHGTWVELHWALDEAGGSGPGPLADIWRTSVPGTLADAEARLLPPHLLLLHVCTHLAYNHTFAFSLRALCDIEAIVREHPDLDWHAFFAIAQAHGQVRGASLALELARIDLGVTVPPPGGAPLADSLIEDARAQLLDMDTLPEELAHAPNLLAWGTERRFWARCRLLWKRVFVAREELALQYGVPAGSLRIWTCYPRRLRDLLQRYARPALALDRASGARYVRLREWLAGP